MALGTRPRLAIVTVNFSTTRWLKLMLITLCEQQDLHLLERIVVVDNGSRDGGTQFVSELDRRLPIVHAVHRRHRLHHGPAMRAGIRALDRIDGGSGVVLLCDTDVIFRSPLALSVVADAFLLGDVGLAGESRRVGGPSPEIQASFLAVRRDVHARRDIAPLVHDGAPTRRLQESVVAAGFGVIDIPSNHGGLILHRGRAGVSAAAKHRPLHQYATARHEPHFMGVEDGAAIWQRVEERHTRLLDPDREEALLAHLERALPAGPPEHL